MLVPMNTIDFRRVHEARIAQQLTVRELAARAGVAPNSVSKAEHGQPLAALTLAKITAALGLTRSADADANGWSDADASPTVTEASRVVLDIPGGEIEGLTPGELAVLRREAELAWLRARAGMAR